MLCTTTPSVFKPKKFTQVKINNPGIGNELREDSSYNPTFVYTRPFCVLILITNLIFGLFNMRFKQSYRFPGSLIKLYIIIVCALYYFTNNIML